MEILIVGDNSVRQNFFRTERAEHTLTFATMSEEGITRLREQAFDLVFLDLDLADGLERGLRVGEEMASNRYEDVDVIVYETAIDAPPERVGLFTDMRSIFQSANSLAFPRSNNAL